MQAPPRPESGVETIESDPPHPHCEIELRPNGAAVILVVRGALDAWSVPALSAQVDQLICTPWEQITLDLCGVEILDCVGCNAIAGLAHDVSVNGGWLSIRSHPGAIRGLLVSTGLGGYLDQAP